MNKPVYSMSSVGQCPRVLAAHRLGYEPIPIPQEELDQLNHYSRLEAVAAQQIMDLGYRIEPSSLCQACKDRYGTERFGVHVEIDLPLYLLVGHLDRRLILNGKRYPVEIKSLGKSSWMKFQRERFNAFTSYAGQECAYLKAEGVPGIYWIMRRDDGAVLKYIVNDMNHNLDLPGFEKITLPITFSEIEDKLNMIEICVSEGTLPEGTITEDCRWCRFKYLCAHEDKPTKEETLPELVVASRQYEEARELEQTASELKQQATQTFLNHSKITKIDKFRVANVSFTYRGQKVKESIDTKALKLEVPEIYEKYKRESKPFDDFSIRILSEKS